MTTYSFLNVAATLTGPGGSIQLGYGAGNAEEGISEEMLEDKDAMTIGADGAVMHSLRAGNGARLTVRLLKTSPVNALLSNLYNFQKASAALWGQNVLVVSDIYRGDVLTVTQSAFSRHTPVTYSKDGNTMEWTFFGTIDQKLGAGVPDINV